MNCWIEAFGTAAGTDHQARSWARFRHRGMVDRLVPHWLK